MMKERQKAESSLKQPAESNVGCQAGDVIFGAAGSLRAELQLLPAFLLTLSLFYCAPSSAAGTCTQGVVARRWSPQKGERDGGAAAPNNMLENHDDKKVQEMNNLFKSTSSDSWLQTIL